MVLAIHVIHGYGPSNDNVSPLTAKKSKVTLF